jgi:hypothetical protein
LAFSTAEWDDSAVVIRSRNMAMMTTDRPASKPSPMFTRVTAPYTSWPSPGAPTIPEMTTIDRASMMTWLTPAMIVGIASGSWIWRRMRRGVEPNACPASTTSLSTCLMPSSVMRTAGGSAKMIVATTPGMMPERKKTTAGIR